MNAADFILTLSMAVYGGDCLGRLPDGRAVFVPFALPGETVRIRLVEEKRGHARGELLEVLAPAGQRRVARCRHFGVCGGCHYQHLPYSEQVTLKTAILREQLERIGHLDSPQVETCVPAPSEFFYRNHIQFHLTSLGQLGFVPSNGGEVFPVAECWLPEEPLNALWPQLDFEAMPEISRVGLRLGYEDDLQIILESSDFQPPELSIEELPASAVHLSPAGSLVLAGSPYVFMQIAGRYFRVSAGSFFQINTAMAESMVDYVLENAGLTKDMLLIDAYCGVGLFSAFLAQKVKRLIGIESSPAACDDFAYNLDEYDNVELYEAPVERVMPELALRPDLILVDPPRAGLSRPVLDGILKLAAPRLIYISCDPATLARDGRRLAEAGYRLSNAMPFDLFPQTYHIESISLWEK